MSAAPRCVGRHGMVAVVLLGGADFMDGPAAGRRWSDFTGDDRPHVLAPGADGVLVKMDGRFFHYHPKPCVDGATADRLYFSYEWGAP